MRVASNKYPAPSVTGKQSAKGSGLKPANYTPLPTRSLARGATLPKTGRGGRWRGKEARGSGGLSGGGGDRGAPSRGGCEQHVGRRSGAMPRRLAGSPHLLRRVLLQHILLHGHGPRGASSYTGGGVRLLAPPPALAATLRRAPGSGADLRGGQRPRQPGAKAMAAGVRGHRGLAARRGQRGPRRQPHHYARPASVRLARRGPGHGRSADSGAREGASSRAASRVRALLRWRSRAAAGKGERAESSRPEWRCPPPS